MYMRSVEFKSSNSFLFLYPHTLCLCYSPSSDLRHGPLLSSLAHLASKVLDCITHHVGTLTRHSRSGADVNTIGSFRRYLINTHEMQRGTSGMSVGSFSNFGDEIRGVSR